MMRPTELAAYLDRRLQQLRRARNLLNRHTFIGSMLDQAINLYEAAQTQVAGGNPVEAILTALFQQTIADEQLQEYAGRYAAASEVAMAIQGATTVADMKAMAIANGLDWDNL